MERVALTAADTAWLHMERSTNPMCVVGLMLFDEPLDFARLRRVIEERLVVHDRFRMRVVEPPLHLGAPHWETDPSFDVAAHLHRAALPEPGDDAALRALVSDLISQRLDFSRPLWQLHLVEGHGAGCALVFRVHHCVGDGIALVRLVLSLTDEAAAGKPIHLPGASQAKAHPEPAGEDPGLLRTALHEGFESLVHPSHALDLAKQGLIGAAKGATSLGKLLLLPPDPETVFKGQLGALKRVAWSGSLGVDEVKAAGQALGGTVNDVLISSMAGALRRYALGRGGPATQSIRAVVPVNLRPFSEEVSLGNQFGLVFLSLPIGVEDPVERLQELKRRMDSIKGSPEAVISFGILAAMGVATPVVEDRVLEIFSTKASAVMTNVPGPRDRLSFADREIQTIMFWVPQSGDIGLGVSIFSYAGQVRLGVSADARIVPDPETIVAGFNAELEALRS
jgi:WS/DGAT/MGAT family acyltransferase